MSEHRGGFFSWFTGKERDTPTRTHGRRPAPRDMAGADVANEEMLWGFYNGNYAGLQFASPLAGLPVDTLVNMIGLPTPSCKGDELTQARLNEITKIMSDRIKEINTTHFVTGTPWAWPRFDADSFSLVWEDIPDSTIPDILVNLVTGKPSAILTDEQIALSTGENQKISVQRKRRFTASDVEVKYIGQRPGNVQDFTARNVAGVLPIPFPHKAKPGDIRGWSLFSGVMRVAKNYHDLVFAMSEILTKFKPKQVQGVEDIGQWCKNNIGTESPDELDSYDVNKNDLIINVEGKESTDFAHLPADATAAYEKALQYNFLLFLEGVQIPEICFGPLAVGNNATAGKDWERLMTIIAAKMRDLTTPYYALYAASLRIYSIVYGETYKPFEMGWANLDAISADVKSQIFQRFAQAISALMGSAGITKQQLWKIWTLRYPESEPGKYDDFIRGIAEMGRHKQFIGEMYGAGLEDFQAQEPEPAAEPDEGAAEAAE